MPRNFAFGCLPWAIWQLQVQGTQSEIAFNFHILSIYYVQDCLRNFKRSKIMYINVENDPEIRFLENIEQFLFSQTVWEIFKRSKINVYKCRKRPRNTISRKYWAIPIFPDNLVPDRIFDKNDKLREILEIRVFT